METHDAFGQPPKRRGRIFRALTRWPALTACCLIVACGGAVAAADKPAYQAKQEQITDQLASQMDAAVPYPIDQMKDSLERRQLRERLLRFNKPSKIGYLYILNLGVKDPIGYYVVKGKISSVESQMTNPTQSWNHKCSSSNGACAYGLAVESMGDDGTFGHNECGDKGVFFFDTNNAMHELCDAVWHYSDAPIEIWKDVPKLGGS